MTLDLDLPTAAYRLVLDDDAIADLVEEGEIGKGVEGAPEQPWVFQGLDDEGRPRVDPEGTGKAVVVLKSDDDWGGAAPQTRRYPVLQVLVYADSSRDAAKAVTAQDARRRCRHVAKRFEDLFHDIENKKHDWGGFFVISSRRQSGLKIMDVPGTQSNTVRGEMTFEVSID